MDIIIRTNPSVRIQLQDHVLIRLPLLNLHNYMILEHIYKRFLYRVPVPVGLIFDPVVSPALLRIHELICRLLSDDNLQSLPLLLRQAAESDLPLHRGKAYLLKCFRIDSDNIRHHLIGSSLLSPPFYADFRCTEGIQRCYDIHSLQLCPFLQLLICNGLLPSRIIIMNLNLF